MKDENYYVYFLQSLKDDSYYIGTSNNVKRILKQDNDGESKSTAPKKPWVLRRIEKFDNIKQAYSRERFIKKKKSRKIIEKIINSKI